VYEAAATVYASRLGGTSFTVTASTNESEPPEFSVDTVCLLSVLTAVGVPVIVPVVGFNARPAGSAGSDFQLTTVPPVTVGAISVIAEPLISVVGPGSDKMTKLGVTSGTVIVSNVVSDPALFVPVMV
jgi:hypothetical protein